MTRKRKAKAKKVFRIQAIRSGHAEIECFFENRDGYTDADCAEVIAKVFALWMEAGKPDEFVWEPASMYN